MLRLAIGYIHSLMFYMLANGIIKLAYSPIFCLLIQISPFANVITLQYFPMYSNYCYIYIFVTWFWEINYSITFSIFKKYWFLNIWWLKSNKSLKQLPICNYTVKRLIFINIYMANLLIGCCLISGSFRWFFRCALISE